VGVNALRLQDYLAEVTKITLLEPAEERTLWAGYKLQGDMDARCRLIERYQPLVVKVLMRWRGNESILMDLVQEGTIGLIDAVEKYEPERGVAFSLYAVHRIRGRMLNYMEKEIRTSALSIETPWDAAEGILIGDTLADTAIPVAEMAEQNFMLSQMKEAMARLPIKENLALSGVYIEEQEPRQVASDLSITPSHLSRLQKQGIRRVRGMLSRLMGEMKK